MILRATLAALTLAGAASAETPLVSFAFGPDVLTAGAADVISATPTYDATGLPALDVQLAPALDPAMAALTAKHVGDIGTVRICDEVVVEPMLLSELPQARLIITGITTGKVAELAALLRSGTCSQAPSS